MNTNNYGESINELMQLYTQNFSELAELLDKERKTLEEAKFNQLEGLAEQKQLVLNEIDRLGQQRLALLKSANITGANATIDTLIRTLGNQEQQPMLKALEELKSLIKKTREKNLINSQIILSTQSYTQRMIHIMQGRDPNEDHQQTYTASGYTQSGSSSTGSIEA